MPAAARPLVCAAILVALAAVAAAAARVRTRQQRASTPRRWSACRPARTGSSQRSRHGRTTGRLPRRPRPRAPTPRRYAGAAGALGRAKPPRQSGRGTPSSLRSTRTSQNPSTTSRDRSRPRAIRWPLRSTRRSSARRCSSTARRSKALREAIRRQLGGATPTTPQVPESPIDLGVVANRVELWTRPRHRCRAKSHGQRQLECSLACWRSGAASPPAERSSPADWPPSSPGASLATGFGKRASPRRAALQERGECLVDLGGRIQRGGISRIGGGREERVEVRQVVQRAAVSGRSCSAGRRGALSEPDDRASEHAEHHGDAERASGPHRTPRQPRG